MKNVFRVFQYFVMTALILQPLAAEPEPASSLNDNSPETQWVAPPPADESGRLVKFDLQASFQHDADLKDQAFSMFDLSAKRQLDDNSVLAEGSVRFRKSLSTTDQAGAIDLRLARISYLEPWLQVTGGRFDLFHMLTPGLFFGAYPVMGIHRVDGIMATIPFSFFFNFGPSQSGEAEASSPLALSFFYTPSLFSAQQVQYDNTQTFWLSQLRFRLESKDFSPTLRVNFGGSASDFFDYSSLNGNYTCSISADLDFQHNYDLTAEYGVQNINHLADTSALTLGLQASRLGTWGAFSLDQIAVEAQFPLGNSLSNAFTGGNGLTPSLAQSPQAGWYAKIRTRLKVLFIEMHITNNQNDFTLARPMAGSIGIPFTGNFGPGNETDGPGTSLRSTSYNDLACMIRTGVEF